MARLDKSLATAERFAELNTPDAVGVADVVGGEQRGALRVDEQVVDGVSVSGCEWSGGPATPSPHGP
ncbi:hypothetical protein [Actinomadura pelletieri]|uniref:hypothetical protein n=1 Tax=Actinomadura pelletieri TaxID=111805 RepID=UPI0011C38124|nr:hypothetical protein [Actinomadura pelletieri]